VHKRIISAVKRVEFSYHCLSLLALTEDKIDDVKDSYCEEFECIFDKFPKYQMEILLGDFSAKVGREDISKLTIVMKVYAKLVMIIELGE
jgi:hypothetical protein